MNDNEENNNNEESVDNPFIDAVHNGKWSDLKASTEKVVATKIHKRVEARKEELINKAIGK